MRIQEPRPGATRRETKLVDGVYEVAEPMQSRPGGIAFEVPAGYWDALRGWGESIRNGQLALFKSWAYEAHTDVVRAEAEVTADGEVTVTVGGVNGPVSEAVVAIVKGYIRKRCELTLRVVVVSE